MKAASAAAAGGEFVALELRDVRKRYGRTPVVRGASLRLHAGERVALIGPNGAGKSTLFDLVSGRASPDSGQILLEGRRIDGLAPHRIYRRGLARSFQVSNVFGRLSVFENLRCATLRSLGVGPVFWRRLDSVNEARVRADALVARLGLQARRDVPASRLTYAEQRALEIGLAVAGEPRVVLLDEPTAGMSRAETARFVTLVRAVTAGRTLLVVEHDMGVVFDLADRIAVLVQGEVVAFDTPAAVRADARVREAYLGAALAHEAGA